MVDNLPSSADMLELADSTTRALDGLPDSEHVVSTLTELNDTISVLPKQVKDLNETLTEMDKGVKPLSNLSSTKANLRALNTSMYKTKSGINGVQKNITGLFKSVPSNSTITETKSKIDDIGPKGGVSATSTDTEKEVHLNGVRVSRSTWKI